MPLKTQPQSSFDKYYYYIMSVQAPDSDVEFVHDTYKDIRGKSPVSLREDFCGTFAISCEWAQLGASYIAHGVDLDPGPIAYGRENYLSQLSKEQQKRVHIHQANVLDPGLTKTDIVLAANFSYYIFKEREILYNYFKNVYETINNNGLFILDCFGGTECQEPNEEETVHKNFSYFWDQDTYNPITHDATFYIHFQKKGGLKKTAFSYDWRMWSIPEIRDIFSDVGFKANHVYWEGTDEDGEGDGIFTKTNQGDNCEAWVAYIVGEK